MSISVFRTALLRCLLALSLLGAGLGIAQAQDRKAITGTTVSLVPLTGFTSSTTFAGLESASTKASLLVAELPPQAHDQLAPIFKDIDKAKANFARQNITVDDIETIETAAGPAPLITGSQEANGTSYDKWMVLLKGERTVLITVQSPDGADLEPDDIVAMLKTVSLGAPPSMADKLKALPFTVAAAEPFRVIDTLGGSGVLMTAGPLDADPSGTQPIIVVAYQLSAPIPTDKLEAGAEALLKQTKNLETATITKRERVPFAGSSGILLSGTATDRGAEKRFAQYMAVGADGRFVRLIAIAPASAYDGVRAGIEKVAASIAFAAK
ncbi:hypothetical protein [Bosea beijingensis]|uniref:hypothetical protein n=1 Tax=Bosea beijingensis TaxID=3068632 RepID=UPI0027426F07|nr:hypothetical protein [Bosea sp. REN20]